MKIIQKTSLYYAILYAHIIPMYFDFFHINHGSMGISGT